MNLRYDAGLCADCKTLSCLKKCIYLSKDLDLKAEIVKIAKGEYSKFLEECVTCYGCEEYCEFKNHPFYRIAELQEFFKVEKVDDDTKKALLKRYEAEGDFVPKAAKKFVHICLFPELKDSVAKSRFFEGYEVLRGRHVFCNMIYLHYGMISTLKERAVKIVENMKKLNAEEVVLYHDECYAFYKSFAEAYDLNIPFRYLHLFEHLYRKLKDADVKELSLRVAYQRNCSNRLIPETDRILDRIFDLIGVERVEREYDKEKALCCGAQFLLANKNNLAYDLQKKNLEDILSSKATHVVFNCPMCYQTLAEKVKAKGLEALMVEELCSVALKV